MLLKLCDGLSLGVDGEYQPGEDEVGLATSCEIRKVDINEGDAFSLIEWTEAQNGDALRKLEELCIEYINND